MSQSDLNNTHRVAAGTDRTLSLSCESVEIWLSQHDCTETAPSDVSEHLSRCRHCRRERDEALRLPPRSAAEIEMTSDPLFVRGVLAQVRDEVTPARRARQRAGASSAKRVAALLLLTLIPTVAWMLAGAPGGGSPLGSEGGLASGSAGGHRVLEPLASTGGEPAAAGVGLGDRWGSSLSSGDELVAQSGWLLVDGDEDTNKEILSF